jgi:hypothetical protein
MFFLMELGNWRPIRINALASRTILYQLAARARPPFPLNTRTETVILYGHSFVVHNNNRKDAWVWGTIYNWKSCTRDSGTLPTKPWPLLGFLILCTVGRTPWTGVQLVARPPPTHRTIRTQNKLTKTSMSWVGFEPTSPAFERAKTVHALDSAATGIGKTWHYGTLKC